MRFNGGERILPQTSLHLPFAERAGAFRIHRYGT
jgi:hypothetical protein